MEEIKEEMTTKGEMKTKIEVAKNFLEMELLVWNKLQPLLVLP